MESCQVCGKDFELSTGYGKQIHFCSRRCFNIYYLNNPKAIEGRKRWNNRQGRTAEEKKEIKKEKNDKRKLQILEKEAKSGNCKFCGKFCKNQNSLRQHETRCNLNPTPKDKAHKGEKWTEEKKAHFKEALKKGNFEKNFIKRFFTCSFCSKTWMTTMHGRGTHETFCKENPNKKIPYNLGLARTKEERERISKGMKTSSNCGGYREGSGRGKKGRYKGFYCDSSWELAYVVYNLEHNIPFERNEEFFPYEFNGEVHNYKPDFIEGGTYIEIKGYFNEQVKAKEKFFKRPLKYLSEKEIQPYIKYVVEKYGKEFWNTLYERK